MNNNLKDFLDKLNRMKDEIGLQSNGTIGSHKGIQGTISFYDPDNDISYELVSLEPEILIGCGCWSGVEFILKKIDN